MDYNTLAVPSSGRWVQTRIEMVGIKMENSQERTPARLPPSCAGPENGTGGRDDRDKVARLERVLEEQDRQLHASTLQVGRLEQLVELLECGRGELQELLDSSQIKHTSLQREAAEAARKLEQTLARNAELESELQSFRKLADRNQNLVERLRSKERELDDVRNQLLSTMVAKDENDRQVQLMRARSRLAEEHVKSLQQKLKR